MPQAKNKSNGGTDLQSAYTVVAGAMIDQAEELERDRAALQERIGANREELRRLDKINALTDEQGDWLDAFYPEKERGKQRSAEEIERTRKVKEAARRGTGGPSEDEVSEDEAATATA